MVQAAIVTSGVASDLPMQDVVPADIKTGGIMTTSNPEPTTIPAKKQEVGPNLSSLALLTGKT